MDYPIWIRDIYRKPKLKDNTTNVGISIIGELGRSLSQKVVEVQQPQQQSNQQFYLEPGEQWGKYIVRDEKDGVGIWNTDDEKWIVKPKSRYDQFRFVDYHTAFVHGTGYENGKTDLMYLVGALSILIQNQKI